MVEVSMNFDIFLFWYWLIVVWVLLVLSIIFFIIALIKKSRKLMGMSVALMLPHILLLLLTFQEIEPVLVYLFIAWFALQILMFIHLYKHRDTAKKS
ncbi:hypothetical protein D0463_12760 [Bacillus sp. V59.32b]|nr:hypothetical protein D0463_12760 [Bacillus sp. V59.32b]